MRTLLLITAAAPLLLGACAEKRRTAFTSPGSEQWFLVDEHHEDLEERAGRVRRFQDWNHNHHLAIVSHDDSIDRIEFGPVALAENNAPEIELGYVITSEGGISGTLEFTADPPPHVMLPEPWRHAPITRRVQLDNPTEYGTVTLPVLRVPTDQVRARWTKALEPAS